MRLRKNQKADLESKRKIFLEIGFIVTLLLVLAAFEYRSYEKTTLDLQLTKADFVGEELPPVILEKQHIVPPPVSSTVIELVDDNTNKLLEFPIIDAGTNEDEAVPVYNPVLNKKDEEIPDDIKFVPFPAVKATFPGGLKAFYQYLRQNLKYPEMAKELGITGTVYIEFGIDKDGSIIMVKILRGIGGGCDEEAIRVIENCPDWIPARQQDKPVPYKIKLPINFNLSK